MLYLLILLIINSSSYVVVVSSASVNDYFKLMSQPDFLFHVSPFIDCEHWHCVIIMEVIQNRFFKKYIFARTSTQIFSDFQCRTSNKIVQFSQSYISVFKGLFSNRKPFYFTDYIYNITLLLSAILIVVIVVFVIAYYDFYPFCFL